MQMNEQALIQRVVKRGDQHAYSQLVRQYQSQVRQSLRQWCKGDHALADDLAQETFIKAYRALQSFRGDSKFSTWLYRIAYNVMVSYFRKHKPMADESAIESEQQHLSQDMQAVDAKRDIQAAMAQLSEDQQRSIHLCLERGFSHQEAADIMNIPLGTVKTNVLRGKQRLQSLLSSWQGEVSNA